jgi:hypothetical protein
MYVCHHGQPSTKHRESMLTTRMQPRSGDGANPANGTSMRQAWEFRGREVSQSGTNAQILS